ncbi:Pestheic acid cluster transcriptional regulator [Lachnellula suecica]|uniref:Pestheic acid cluster transcriptional regulator n=1 Tax=Lachnellula suecica TaxID=602035 RepID=A0A8T9C6U8_9HELO|nr:Pestheic acid cluster transcriptional regulator [Lachnellula suecica]
MNGPLRSKQGCWTCRLRKKKCDEKHPFCSTCESLSITCYGYGQLKPDWMDNGEKEKAMANSIKQVVKHTSRRKGRLATSITQLQKHYSGKRADPTVVKIAPKSTGASSSSSPGSKHEADQPNTESSPPEYSTQTNSLPRSSNEPTPELTSTRSDPSSIPAVAGNEAVLLMHFLDNVFCLQYPLYKPGVIEGGRGWLLSLLLRTKPLYHASLALSAYHRSMMFVTGHGYSHGSSGIIEQQKHLTICLDELQQAIKEVGNYVSHTCPTNSLGMMASTVQLIFFELFAGHGDAWKIHLHAANMILRGPRRIDNTSHFLKMPLKDLHLTAEGENPEDVYQGWKSEELVIFRFLSAVIAWLGIISCITTGRTPGIIHLLPDEVSDTETNLETVMGCSNCVMVQVSRIAALHEYRQDALQRGFGDCEEFRRKADDIKRDLQSGIAESSLSFLSISDAEFASACNPFITPQMFTTQLYAIAASIYLHLVVFGYSKEKSEPLNAMVSGAVTLIRRHIPADLTHALVCPLYIIGTAIRSEDEPTFRHIFSSPPLLDPSLEHRARFLPLLEKIWVMREIGWDWNTVIQLSGSNLLLL